MRRAMLLLVLAVESSALAYDPTTPLAAEALRSDLLVLRQLLEQSHPGLYRYTSKAAIDRAFDAAAGSVDRPMDEGAFYREVTAVLAKVKDGHTRAFLSGDYRRHLREDARKFPLALRVLDRRIFVANGAGSSAPRGAEVLSVSGESSPALLRSLLDHVSGDADIVTGKLAAIGDDFATYYYVLCGRPRAFRLQLRDRSGKKFGVDVPALTQAEIELARASSAKPAPAPAAPLRFELLDGGRTGLLTIETFALPPEDEGGPDYTKFLARTFAQLARAGVRDLVIDLRGNDGGANLGPLLVSYLVDHPVRFYDSVESVSVGFPLLHRYSHLDEKFTMEFEDHLISVGNTGRYRIVGNEELAPEPLPPRAELFRGRVYVLIDGHVFSTAAQACSVLRKERRATFIGEETGGAYHGNCSGEQVVVTLPASKLRVVIPLLRYEMAGSDKEAARRGVVPEHAVPATASPEEEDAPLAKALDLIRSRR